MSAEAPLLRKLLIVRRLRLQLAERTHADALATASAAGRADAVAAARLQSSVARADRAAEGLAHEPRAAVHALPWLQRQRDEAQKAAARAESARAQKTEAEAAAAAAARRLMAARCRTGLLSDQVARAAARARTRREEAAAEECRAGKGVSP